MGNVSTICFKYYFKKTATLTGDSFFFKEQGATQAFLLAFFSHFIHVGVACHEDEPPFTGETVMTKSVKRRGIRR